MQCHHCKEEIIDGAKICRFCGRDAPEEARRKRNRRFGFYYFIAAIVAIFGIILIANGQPKTYQKIAGEYASDCVINKGWGHWIGSLGVTLEDFCKSAGLLHALEEQKKDHPQRF